MNIKELKEYIQDLPDDMEIATNDDWLYYVVSDLSVEITSVVTRDDPDYDFTSKNVLIIK